MEILEYNERLSTDELAKRMNVFPEDSYLAVYNDVPDFDPYAFVKLVNEPTSPLMIVSTADGLVGEDFKDDQVTTPDFSRNTKFFDVHKDGLAYPVVPHMFLLHAENAGSLNIPTFFVDSQEVIAGMEPDDVEQLRKLEMVIEKTNGKVYRHPVVMPHSQTGEPVLYLASERVVIRPMDRHMSTVSARDTARVANTVFDLTIDLRREHEWHSGQAVVFDNERLLHGRGVPKRGSKGAQDTRRKLNRIWMAPASQGHIFQR